MIYIVSKKGFFMVTPAPKNEVRKDLEVLKLLREYGELHRYAVIAFLKSIYPQETDSELNLVVSRLVSDGRLIRNKNDKLGIKFMKKPR